MIKSKRHKLRQYNGLLLEFVWTDDLLKVAREYEVVGEVDRTGYGFVSAIWISKGKDDYRGILLALNSKMINKNNMYWVLAHELIHVRSFIYIALGITCDCPNDEAEAYLMTYLMKRGRRFFKKQLKKPV